MINLRNTHPNPQKVREIFMLLDGEWDFCFDTEDIGMRKLYYEGKNFGETKTINVPYCYQSPRSGIGIKDESKVVWYKRKITIPANYKNKKIIFHFEASDYETSLFVNGSHVGTHFGGHSSFSFDITDYAKTADNLIVIRVKDESSARRVLGKQSNTNRNFGCWYTRTTGIWQSVWLEAVPKTYIKKFKLTPHIDLGELEILAEIDGANADGAMFTAEVSMEGKHGNHAKMPKRIISATAHNNLVRLRMSIYDITFEIPFWSPERPRLCDIKLSLKSNDGEDNVLSYFGFRNIRIFGDRVYLNDRQYYQKLILNQGYYGDGLLTGTDEEFIHDITMTKDMGFNGMRIHQKTESRRLLYHCDRLGLLCWAELASPYSHDSFATPNIFSEIGEMVEKHYNHPCVVAWTPFNESWGITGILTNKRQQEITLAARQYIRSLDEQTRPVISNDGWEHTISDILTIHDYEQNSDLLQKFYAKCGCAVNFDYPQTQPRKRFYAEGYAYRGEPVFIDEYGGIAFEVKKYSNEDWGYGQVAKTKEEFYERFEKMHRVLFNLDYITGLCYTQLTDVEQEINGLLDAEHKPKFDNQKIKGVLDMSDFIKY